MNNFVTKIDLCTNISSEHEEIGDELLKSFYLYLLSSLQNNSIIYIWICITSKDQNVVNVLSVNVAS